MKARVKATGEIVEVNIDYRQDAAYVSTSGQLYWQRELDFNVENKDPDYWEKLKHQYAGMAMQGILSNESIMCELDSEGIVNKNTVVANMADRFATALVEKLKRSGSQ